MALSNELWSDGMFLDGVYYATISKNLSNGLGSFWFLPSIASSDVFHGHPPLAMGLQSIFFSIFGDSIYIERFYSLLTFIVTGFFIHLIWKEVIGKKYSLYSWVVLFFWVIIPLNSWACSNNILENTMNIFVASSVFFLIKNIRTNDLVYIIISGVCLSLAFLSKGFTGLFPLSFFFLYYLVFPSMTFKEMIRRTLLLIASTLTPFLLLYVFYPPAIDSLSEYINVQVIDSLKNVQTTNNRFSITTRLFNYMKFIHLFTILSVFVYIVYLFRRKVLDNIFLILMTILFISCLVIELFVDTDRNFLYIYNYVFLLLFLIYQSRSSIESNIISSASIRWIIFFMLLGFSGVLPMIISLKQGGFYILTALPYFVISFTILIIPILSYILDRFSLKRKIVYLFVLILFILYGPFISYSSQINISQIINLQLNSFKSQYKKDVRDKSLRDDIRLILKELPENAIVSIDFQKHNIIHGYFARYENISLDTDRGNQHKYLISFEDGWSYEASKKISSISNKNTTGEYLEEATSFQKNQKAFNKDYRKIELNTNKLHLYQYQSE